jgi:tRNA-intron endonuclease
MEKTTLIKNKVIVFDQRLASRIFNKGYFGSFENRKLELSLEEGLYLMEKKQLEVYNRNGKKMSIRSFITFAERTQKRFWARYCVFKYLRSMGYVVKTAFKYGGDFRVYNKGDKPGKAHAAWILYVATEHESMPFLNFTAVNRIAHSVKKNTLFGVVDDEDSVTFYEIRWIKI